MKKYFISLLTYLLFLGIVSSPLLSKTFAVGETCTEDSDCGSGGACEYAMPTDSVKHCVRKTSNSDYSTGGGVENCDIVLKNYEAVSIINKGAIDSNATMGLVGTGAIHGGYAFLMGQDPTDTVSCEGFILGQLRGSTGGRLGFAGTQVCSTNDTEKCGELVNSAKTVYKYDGKPTKLLAIDGSFWGIASQIENVNRQDPIVLNLAYYWNDQIAHVPFVNKALAAPVSNYANMPILNSTLSLWKAARNVSLGLISVVLLYTGIMIVMRKKVNPQLVVTVQYAIPKILVGLILIIFSFPIGAAITSISWALFRGAGAIIANLATGNNLTSQELSGYSMAAIIVAGLKNGLAGIAYLVLTIIIILVMVMLKIAVEVKAMLIYIKMVLSTVIAPFEFALGTVPGNDDKVKGWFTRMAKYGISVFAMGLVIPATLMVALNLLLIYSGIDPTSGTVSTNIEIGGMGSFLAIIGPLIVVIFGFSLALSMESTIDKTFFGGGKKK